MGCWVTAAENKILNHFFRNENIAGIGDATGLRGSTADGNFRVTGCTAWPGEVPDQATNEATFSGYVRRQVGRGTANWTSASGGSLGPVNDISLGVRTDNGAMQEISFIIIGDDNATGAGTAHLWGALGDATFGARPFCLNSTTNDTVLMPAHGLSADMRIAFFEFEPFGTGMSGTGLTEGTVYYVISTGLTTDEFKVSTTQGGSAVNITALGSGWGMKIIPIQVTQGAEAKIAAGSFIRLT